MQSMKATPNVTLPELFSFLGSNMIMGYHELPSSTGIWSCEPDISVLFLSSALPRNCLAEMNDNVSIPNNNTDKLYKLRPMINNLNSNFAKLYNLSHHLIDIVQKLE